MRTVRIQIKAPVWGGGRPAIGVATFRVNGQDMVEVEILYTRKDGNRSYPDIYFLPVQEVVKFPQKTVGGGVRLYVVPLEKWSVKPNPAYVPKEQGELF